MSSVSSTCLSLSRSTSASTLMNCSSCKKLTSIHKLVRVHGKTWKDSHGGGPESSLKVCGNCLVGYHIPVLRLSTGKWEFGTVQSHDGSGRQYQVVFVDEGKEWVYARDDPYEAYAQHFEDILHVLDSPKKTLDHSSNEQQNAPLYTANSMDSTGQFQRDTFLSGKFNVSKVRSSLLLFCRLRPRVVVDVDA